MGGDVETIKDRLDIAEVVGGYVKLEKAGNSFKARCPFHSEKTPSFFVSPLRQSFYCFGCGAKGDIFTFIEEVEGLDFRAALKLLAERAGVELKNQRGEGAAKRTEKDKILEVLEQASMFFENNLKGHKPAREYLASRGISAESIKAWNIGYAPAEWRALYAHLSELGYPVDILLKAGLIKQVEPGSGKSPYDVFRDRLIFPLKNTTGDIIAFSGRALAKETEPKYLNSPDTVVFTKHDVLYGLDKANSSIRRKDYAVLVEGQMDLVMSHQAGIDNTIASSGTAFTKEHLVRLKRFSSRIILAFDGDKAGESAAEKSTALGLSLGLEVKVARLPKGQDPAEVAKEAPDKWRDILRSSKPAIEHFLDLILEEEKDARKIGKLIEKKLLLLVALVESSIERSHFLSLIATRTGIKEEILWEDLKKVKTADFARKTALSSSALDARSTPADAVRDGLSPQNPLSWREQIEERLSEVRQWLKEMPEDDNFKKEEAELMSNLAQDTLKGELSELAVKLSAAETSKDHKALQELAERINSLHKEMRALEEKKNLL